VTPSTALAAGAATWWIQTYNSAGTGAWSSGKAFTVSLFPDVRGTYTGSGAETLTGCIGISSIYVPFAATVRITSQTGSSFSGSTTLTATVGGNAYRDEISLTGTVNASGQFSGSTTDVTYENGLYSASGSGSFSGSLVGNTLSVSFTGQDTAGDTCSTTGSLMATR
jgi:hypothetical protein